MAWCLVKHRDWIHMLRTESSDGFLRTWKWTFGFRNRRGISWLAEWLLAYQEGLCPTKLVSFIFFPSFPWFLHLFLTLHFPFFLLFWTTCFLLFYFVFHLFWFSLLSTTCTNNLQNLLLTTTTTTYYYYYYYYYYCYYYYYYYYYYYILYYLTMLH
jgi:hypothetical protein